LVGLTEHGEAVLAEAMPCWQSAQDRLLERLGEDGWTRALTAIESLVGSLSPRKGPKPPGRPAPAANPTEEATGAKRLTPAQMERLRGQFCMCTMLRQGARSVSKYYDDRLRPHDLKISQFHLLAAVAAHPGTRIVDLVETLTLDQTTLTRMLQRLTELEFVERGRAQDERRGLHLLGAGERALTQGFFGWEKAQEGADAVPPESGLEIRPAFAAVLTAVPSDYMRGRSLVSARPGVSPDRSS
jgi:DNA-binding MarR family transcriptional regulator